MTPQTGADCPATVTPIWGAGSRPDSGRTSVRRCSARGARTLDVLIIEPDALSRFGLRQILTSADTVCVVGAVGTISEAEHLPATVRAGLILVSAGAPDLDGGLGIAQLSSRFTGARVVMLGAYAVPPLIIALRHGADGYLPRDIAPAALVCSLHRVMRGEITLPRSDVQLLVESLLSGRRGDNAEAALVRLSPRERDVLAGISQGDDIARIAERLGVREATVKAHIARLLRKTGAQAR